jgi:hypothetical protein
MALSKITKNAQKTGKNCVITSTTTGITCTNEGKQVR